MPWWIAVDILSIWVNQKMWIWLFTTGYNFCWPRLQNITHVVYIYPRVGSCKARVLTSMGCLCVSGWCVGEEIHVGYMRDTYCWILIITSSCAIRPLQANRYTISSEDSVSTLWLMRLRDGLRRLKCEKRFIIPNAQRRIGFTSCVFPSIDRVNSVGSITFLLNYGFISGFLQIWNNMRGYFWNLSFNEITKPICFKLQFYVQPNSSLN